MHADEKARTLNAIADCLWNSSVADSLPERWRGMLLEEHYKDLDRDRAIGRTIKCELGRKPGWVTVEQGGGGIFVHLWSLEARRCTEARAAMEDLASRLRSAATHLGSVYTRFIAPHEMHSRRGWPPIGD